jgi:hypothetical protein
MNYLSINSGSLPPNPTKIDDQNELTFYKSYENISDSKEYSIVESQKVLFDIIREAERLGYNWFVQYKINPTETFNYPNEKFCTSIIGMFRTEESVKNWFKNTAKSEYKINEKWI